MGQSAQLSSSSRTRSEDRQRMQVTLQICSHIEAILSRRDSQAWHQNILVLMHRFFLSKKYRMLELGAGVYASQKREDYSADDVEHYFNYMGMLATEVLCHDGELAVHTYSRDINRPSHENFLFLILSQTC